MRLFAAIQLNHVGIPISDDSAKMAYYAVYRISGKKRFDGIIKTLAGLLP